jgi:tripartite-type tricarboxylate transporter receptor subunit TctC
VLSQPDTRARLVELGALPVGDTPTQFAELIARDRKRYAAIIKERNITAE